MLNNNSTTCFRTKPKKTQFLRHTNQRCVFKNCTYSDVVIQSLKVVELMSTFDISEINLIGAQPPDRCWSICSPFRNGKMVIQKTSIYSKVVLVVMQLQGPTLSTNPRDPGSPYLRMVSWNLTTFRLGGDYTPLAHHLTFGDWIPRGILKFFLFHPIYFSHHIRNSIGEVWGLVPWFLATKNDPKNHGRLKPHMFRRRKFTSSSATLMQVRFGFDRNQSLPFQHETHLGPTTTWFGIVCKSWMLICKTLIGRND